MATTQVDYSKYGGRIVPATDIDYSKYGGTVKAYEGSPEDKNKGLIDSLPEPFKSLFLSQLSATQFKPEERMAGMGRGFTEIGQGAKQMGLQGAEALGMAQPGSAEEYTKQKNIEKELYEKSPAGQDEIAKLLRSQTQGLPLLLAGGPALMESGLLKKMLWGGAGGAGYGSYELLDNEKDRLSNMLTRGLEGAGLGFAQGLPKSMDTAAVKIGGPLKNVWQTLTKSIDEKGLAKSVQAAHDALEKKAKDIYKSVRGESVKRNIGNLEISDDILNAAEKHLSSAAEDKALIKSARNGEYKALRDLQSQLGEEGSSYLSSDLASEKKIGREIMSIRKQINSAIEQNLEKEGHKDLAEQIKEANDLYTKKHEIYYSHPTIRRMVDKKKGRVVPKNPMNAFAEDSDRIQPLLQAHPEVQSAAKLHEDKKKLMKKLAIPGAAAAFGGGDALIRYLLGR